LIWHERVIGKTRNIRKIHKQAASLF